MKRAHQAELPLLFADSYVVSINAVSGPAAPPLAVYRLDYMPVPALAAFLRECAIHIRVAGPATLAYEHIPCDLSDLDHERWPVAHRLEALERLREAGASFVLYQSEGEANMAMKARVAAGIALTWGRRQVDPVTGELRPIVPETTASPR